MKKHLIRLIIAAALLSGAGYLAAAGVKISLNSPATIPVDI